MENESILKDQDRKSKWTISKAPKHVESCSIVRNLFQPLPFHPKDTEKSKSQKYHVNVAGKPAKLYHVGKLCGCFTLQLPAQEQINITLKHHENPVALWAVPQPVPNESNVELSKHERGWAKPWLLVILRCLLDLGHRSLNSCLFNFGVLPLYFCSLFIIYFQIWRVAALRSSNTVFFYLLGHVLF